MILKSFGDSFIFGSDLADSVSASHIHDIVASQNTWTAVLAKKLGLEYECFARPGAGNLQIAEQILNQAQDARPSVFAVSWSWIDRFDYWDTNPNWINKNHWRTINPTDTSQQAESYFKYLHSEYRDKLCSLMFMRMALDTMIGKNIPFVMTYQDDLIFDQKWHATPAMIELQNYVKSKMTLFEGKTFLQWSQQHGFEISANMHPLEQAHKAAADYVIEIFDTQKTSGLVQQVRV